MNTSWVGEVSLAKVLAALVALGKQVLLPFGNSGRSDLVIEEEDGTLFRVQCKTGRIFRGALYVPTSSTVARSRSGVKTVRTPCRGQVDLFGVYCPDNETVLLVPVNDVPPTAARLRIDPPKTSSGRAFGGRKTM